MKINEVINENILSEAPPGQLAQRAQQRNVAPSAQQPASIQTPQEPEQLAQQPAQGGGKISKFWQGLAKGIGFDQTAQAIQNYNNPVRKPARPTQPAAAGQVQPGLAQPDATTSQKPSGNALASQIKSEWDAFVQAGGNASPALRQQIKQMWLDAGGIRAEGKKNKKKPV